MKRLLFAIIFAVVPTIVLAQEISFTNPDIEFKFKRCICTGSVAYIDLVITNYSGKTMTPYCGHLDRKYGPDMLVSRVYDDEGNEYVPTAKIGDDYHMFGVGFEFQLPPEVPIKMRITIKDVDKYAAEFTMLTMGFANMDTGIPYDEGVLKVRHIPITRQ